MLNRAVFVYLQWFWGSDFFRHWNNLEVTSSKNFEVLKNKCCWEKYIGASFLLHFGQFYVSYLYIYDLMYSDIRNVVAPCHLENANLTTFWTSNRNILQLKLLMVSYESMVLKESFKMSSFFDSSTLLRSNFISFWTLNKPLYLYHKCQFPFPVMFVTFGDESCGLCIV